MIRIKRIISTILIVCMTVTLNVSIGYASDYENDTDGVVSESDNLLDEDDGNFSVEDLEQQTESTDNENGGQTETSPVEDMEEQSMESVENGESLQELKENSWRYTDGILTVDEPGMFGRSNFTPWTKVNGNYVNSFGDIIPNAKARGIDVSEHQGYINWDQVKKSDVSFAIIRCGYGDNYTSQDDKRWLYNVTECERLGIPYGVYLYSYAKTTEQARNEAEHVLRLISGRRLSYPVFYDLEDDKTTGTLSNDAILSIAQTFCTTIANAGYPVGVYANTYWFNTKLTNSYYDTLPKWVAQYNYQCEYQKEYMMWQCTSKGAVDGISGYVDLNFVFTDWTCRGVNTDRVSPQNINTPIKLEADIQGNIEGFQYKFVINDIAQNTWTTIQDLSQTNNAMWQPNKEGEYKIFLNVVDRDSVWHAYEQRFTIINLGWNCAGVKTDKESPQGEDTEINLSADMSGNTEGIQYKFVVNDLLNNTWTTIKPLSQVNRVTWTPTQPGSYKIFMNVIDRNGIWYEYQKPYTITDAVWSCGGIKTDKASPQVEGTKIKLSAEMTGNTKGIQYKFLINDIAQNTWTVIKDLSTTNNTTWMPTRTGSYIIFMNVVDKKGKWHEYKKEYTITAQAAWGCAGIKTDKSSPQETGTEIKLSAEMSGNTNGMQYKFVINDVTKDTWDVIKPLSDTNNVAWRPSRAGSYKIFMNVVDRNGTWHTYEKVYAITATTWNCMGIKTDKSSPQELGTGIKLSAEMSGNTNGIQYKFVINDVAKDRWDVIKPLSDINNVTWRPDQAGSYKIFMNVVDRGGTWHTYEKAYTITAATWNCMGIKTDKSSPQKTGIEIKLSAEMGGNTNGMQYKFVINNVAKDTWDTIKLLSETNNVTWKPDQAGSYKIFMNVVDRGGTWHTYEIPYQITK